MQVMVLDGMGGGIGRAVLQELLKHDPKMNIIAVGTNSIATSNMMKAGSITAATGENAAVFNAGQSDIIIGPVGIILANAMYGEITPLIAATISGCSGKKVLIPVPNQRLYIAGIKEQSLGEMVQESVKVCISLME